MINSGAIDAEGDSLVYSFCSPLTGAAPNAPAPNVPASPPYLPITYVPSYTAEVPIIGNPVITIDPQILPNTF